MNKVYVVVGLGPNSVSIPCLVFKTKEEADAYITKHPAPDYDREGNELWRPYFTKYYDGCGECYRMEVKEVEFGKPFIGWDLD
jgi:hypothetical protein